ncbi:MAG: hypothetical protein GEV08_17380 [Acidimicrobiia bacterium]|nr:hypothetical protein [Acidimicrobiia bacterium]
MTSTLNHRSEERATARQRCLADAAAVAAEVSAPRAATWDRDNAFPAELFAALHEVGLDAMTVPYHLGGLGLGPDAPEPDPLTVWLVTRALAGADSASSHAVQVHTNAVHCLAMLGTDEQQERYLRPVVEEGAVFGFWGSEQSGAPAGSGDGRPRFTVARRVEGGWLLSGRKFYSTNARGARYGIVFAVPEGARNAMADLLLFVVDCRGEGVNVAREWWDRATGMRATTSDEVVLDGVFVPDHGVIGEPGAYWSHNVQARYLPQFSANFQGVGRHFVDHASRYVSDRGRSGEVEARRRIGEANVQLASADALLCKVAELYEARDLPAAYHHSRMLRSFSQLAVERVIRLTLDACGASVHFDVHPFSRMLRDWESYSRHERLDLLLEALGGEDLSGTIAAGPAAFGFHERSTFDTSG